MAITLNGSTGITAAGNVLSSGNVLANVVFAESYYYANGTPFTGGGASTGNIGFSNVTMYSLNGLAVNNSDLSHGATSGLNVPTNGSGTAELFNTYGDVNIIAGTGPSHTYNFGADGIAELGQIVATGNIVGGNLNTGGVVSSTGNITGANVNTGGVVSATGNVRGANLNTAGIVSATGNITGGNVVTTGNVAGNYFIGNGLYGTASNDTAVLGNASGLIRVLVQDNGVNIQTYDHPNLNYHTWTFNSAGDVYLPDGNVGIYYANGQPYGGSSTGNVGFDNNNIYNTQGGGLILSNFNFVTDEAETAYVQIPAGNSASDLNVVQEQGNVRLVANTAVWNFDTAGTITLPNGGNIRSVDELTIINSTATANGVIGINARESTFGDSVAQVYLDGTDRVVRISTFNPETEIGYDWTFDAGGSFTLPTAPGNIYMGINSNGPFINPTSLGIELNANRADEAQDYILVSQDGINLFSVHPIVIDNSTTGLLNTDINITSGDDILLQGRNKPDDSEAEGGDINIYAGLGASAVTSGNDTGGGGDIQIGAGDGGSDTGGGFGGSAGGTITIFSGDGGAGDTTTNAGGGGSLSITAGSAAGVANTALGGLGGTISITAGDTTRINEIGGTISLNTGAASGDGTSPAGYLEINIPSSNVGPGGTWTFSGVGNELNVPGNSSIYGANFGNFTVGCAGNTIVTSSVYGSGNVKNWVFGATGDLTLPDGEPTIRTPDQTGIINLRVQGGETEQSLLQLGSDGGTDQFIYMSSQNDTGNAATISMGAYSGQAPYTTIRTYDGVSVQNDWTFTHAAIDPTEAYLYVPGGASITTPNATGGGAGKVIFIEAGAADQGTYNTNAGGDLYLKGGRGATNDGGGGGPGGDVNINAGESADPAGVAGNVYITAGALRNWTFDNTGNLSLPMSGNIVGLTANNNGYLNWFGNSSGDGNGYTTLRLIPDDTRESADQYLIIDPTAPGHIHIRAGGTQDNSNADLILGGENSYFKVAAGSNSVATIASNSNVWQFGTDGNLIAPGDVSGQVLISAQSAANEGGEIRLALPSSGSTLSGNIIIDSYQNQVRIFEGGGNTRGLYVDVPNVSVSGQYAIGYRDVPQIALSGNVTANSITAGKHFYSTTAGNLQITIPDNANVAFPLGATLTVVMNAAGNVVVAQGTGVSLYMAGSSTTGNRTVGAYGLASVMKVATDTWVISGTGVY